MSTQRRLALAFSSLIAMSVTVFLSAQPAAAASSCTKKYAPVTDYAGRTFNYRYYCSTYVPEAMYWNVNSGDVKMFDDSGFMYWASSVWVICQYNGRPNPTIDGHTNTWWLYTWGDGSRSNAGGYANGWGFLPATSVSQGGENQPIPGVPSCSSVNSSVIPPVSSWSTEYFQVPLGGWFAKDNGTGNATDPVNVVVYGSRGDILTIMENALSASGWAPTLCFNNSILLDTDLNWNSPNTVWTTSGSLGCGWSYERNHARMWTGKSADWSFVWVAASYEHYCMSLHCISDNGFDRGANDFYIDLSNGLAANNVSHTISILYPYPYSPGTINSIPYGNAVTFIRIN